MEAAGNPNTPFNLIEETVSVVLESEVSLWEQVILDFYKGFKENSRQYLCNFFSSLVKYWEKDVRYYVLIHTMFTFQRRHKEYFPLGFCVTSPEFNEQVLAKLPPKMWEKLEKEDIVINKDKGFDTYSLQTGYFFWI